MPVKSIEVLVIGAGPAGSTVSRFLAEAGREVLIIDKQSFPRHKTCGGGVPPRTSSLLGLNYKHLIKSTVDSFTLLAGWRGRLEITDVMMAEVVDRTEFDDFLLCKAIAAGVEFSEKTAIEALEFEDGRWKIETSQGRINAKIVCACDGALSKTSRLLGEPLHPLGFALEGYLPRSSVLNQPGKNTAFFELSCVRNGYGWAFPRSDEYAVGIGIRQGSAVKLRASLKKLCSHRGISRLSKADGFQEPQRIKGAALPYFVKPRAWYAKDNLYFIGDAASLVDPFTGEGLFLAVQSGRFAAESIIAGSESLYNDRIQTEIISELEIAADYVRKSDRIPGWLIGFILGRKRAARYADLFVDLLKGDITYRQLYAKMH